MSNTYFNISKYFHYAENENYYKEITSLIKNEIKNTDKKKENTILNSKKID